jgi:hypothetical protein
LTPVGQEAHGCLFPDPKEVTMYILVQHTVSDPTTVWSRAQQALPSVPSHLKLHHSIPTPDGRKATCVWEAASIETLKSYLDPMLGPDAHNQYFEVVNKEGVALPTALQLA